MKWALLAIFGCLLMGCAEMTQLSPEQQQQMLQGFLASPQQGLHGAAIPGLPQAQENQPVPQVPQIPGVPPTPTQEERGLVDPSPQATLPINAVEERRPGTQQPAAPPPSQPAPQTPSSPLTIHSERIGP
jgi:hypothetical protein